MGLFNKDCLNKHVSGWTESVNSQATHICEELGVLSVWRGREGPRQHKVLCVASQHVHFQ